MTPKKTPIEQHQIDRATGIASAPVATPSTNIVQRALRAAIRYALGNEVVNTWQGPGQVLVPVAQEEQGRLFDFPATVNTTARPRSTEAIDFATLRALANNYDLMRLVIERRKDQMEKLKFKFVTDNPGDVDEEDARVKQLREFFAKPDKVHRWGPWLRMVVEEMLVIDALTIYPRMTNGGELYSLDVMDGATIKPLIDNQGRRPMMPQPAYQQFVKGSPMAFYNIEELIYAPRNPRADKFYGFSPVEQVIMTVNIALRRQMHQLYYYTEGNTPEGLVPVPETWTPKQLREFQNIWDSEMLGDLGAKRKLKFIPNVKNVIWTREPNLKDQMDEWLGRVICLAFSYPPSALTAQVNRATAETAQTVGEDEGLTPIMLAVKNVIDEVIATKFGWDDVKFQWDTDRTLDPKTQADIDAVDAESGVRTIDEIRKARGLQPYGIAGVTDVPIFQRGPSPKEQAEQEREEARLAAAATGAESGKPGQPGAQAAAGSAPTTKPKPGEEDGTKVAKAHGIDGSVSDDELEHQQRAVVKSAEDELAAVLEAAFAEAARELAKEVGTVEKADVARWVVKLTGAFKVLRKALRTVTEDSVKHAVIELDASGTDLFKMANKRAKAYADARAGELLKAGPDGEAGLEKSTREMLRAYLADAAERGATNDEIAKHLVTTYAFSAKRARTIARTELRKADVQGALAAYAESGVVVGKRWLLSNEEHRCEVCEGNAAQGIVDLEKEFDSGDQGPPAHPNCRCDIAPVTKE